MPTLALLPKNFPHSHNATKKTKISRPRMELVRRSTATMEDDLIIDEQAFWKCRKHPSRPRSGVCPSCLRDRLLLLCPDCASLLPCGCLPSPSSASSSSFSSLSSFDPHRSSVSGAIGAIGRVSILIESEPAFQRSRSAAFTFLRARSEVEEMETADKRKKWRKFWEFLRGKNEEEMSRSRSTAIDPDEKLKGRRWNFPTPIRAFRQRKTARVVQERSPLCRG